MSEETPAPGEPRVYMAYIDDGDPALDQAAAAARDDLDRHIESMVGVLNQGADDAQAVGVAGGSFLADEGNYPPGRLAYMLAAALVRFARPRVPVPPTRPDRFVDCPRAPSPESPCVARDGRVALANDGDCVGCGANPGLMLEDLARKHPAAVPDRGLTGRDAADALQRHVHGYLGLEGQLRARLDPDGA